MRKFSFITIGRILDRLEDEGCRISRPTFLRLMTDKKLFQMHKNINGWYVCSPERADEIVVKVLENYNAY